MQKNEELNTPIVDRDVVWLIKDQRLIWLNGRIKDNQDYMERKLHGFGRMKDQPRRRWLDDVCERSCIDGCEKDLIYFN